MVYDTVLRSKDDINETLYKCLDLIKDLITFGPFKCTAFYKDFAKTLL